MTTDLSSTALSQACDSQYEGHLRTLPQVQNKRATILENYQSQEISQKSDNIKQRDKETLKEVAFGPYKILAPARYFTPVKKAENNDVIGCEEKPNTITASEESPIRSQGRKICHSVPPALRYPPSRKLNVNTTTSRILPKKRQSISSPEDAAPARKVGKIAQNNVQANNREIYPYRQQPLSVAEGVPDIPFADMTDIIISGQPSFQHSILNENSFDVRKVIETMSVSNEAKVDKSRMTMEEFGQYILDIEEPPGEKSENRATASEEEQFAEILEALFKHDEYLPPEIKDELFSMFVHTKTMVAGNILDTETIKDDVVDLTIDDNDNELGFIESRRLADNEVNQKELERSVKENSAGVIQKAQTTATVLYDTIDCNSVRYPKIRDVEVEMDNSGEIIFNEIAGFFGYDGYVDYLTYQDPEDTGTIEEDGEYKIDNEILLFD